MKCCLMHISSGSSLFAKFKVSVYLRMKRDIQSVFGVGGGGLNIHLVCLVPSTAVLLLFKLYSNASDIFSGIMTL